MRARRPLRSRTKLRAKNPDRRQYDPQELEAFWEDFREWEDRPPIERKRLSEIQFGSEAFQRFCHQQLCQIDGCYERDVEMAHSRSRAAGGRWTDVAILCRSHHRESHDLGRLTWEAKYGLSLHDLAAEVQRRWKELNGETNGND